MRIIEWNCQGAFRKKNKKILELNPDILIVPECEKEEKLEFGKLTPNPTDFFWYSSNESKGIGIFSYSDYKFELLNEFNPKFRYIIPLKVSNNEDYFLLFAIWAMDNKEEPQARYIAQVWLALNYYSHLLNLSTILVGDFNSNQIWDVKERLGNHSDVVEILRKNKIHSLYHSQKGISHGKEEEYTFFMYRKIEKPYHIDYCFASEDFFDNGINLRLGEPTEWLEFSDHIPLIIETNKSRNNSNFETSLLKCITQKSEQLNPITIEKFSSVIEKLKENASHFDLNNSEQQEKITIIETMEKLIEVDKKIQEIKINGY